MELWRYVIGYEGLYQVSNKGRVRSVDRIVEQTNRWGSTTIRVYKGKILNYNKNKWGYLTVRLSKDGIKTPFSVHRLVAEAFIPNLDNLPQVNHKDEDKHNNSVENLEWCSRPYNINYGKRNEIVSTKLSKQVYQCTLDGKLVKLWNSLTEADRCGFNRANVIKCCKGGYYYKGKWYNMYTYKGYKWSYEPL